MAEPGKIKAKFKQKKENINKDNDNNENKNKNNKDNIEESFTSRSLALQPELTIDEIRDIYTKIPSCSSDLSKYESHVDWLEYEQLPNIGRNNRNAWLIFQSQVLRHP